MKNQKNLSKKGRLVFNTIIIFFSKFCTQFLSLFILPFITSALATDEYGTFDLINTLACLLGPYMSLQIENGMFRFLIDTRNDKDGISNNITNGMILILLQVIIFTIIYFIVGHIFTISNYNYIYIYALSYIALNVPLYIARGLGDNVGYAISSIIVGVLNVLISIITVCVLKYGMVGLVIAGVISNIVGGIFLLIRNHIFKYIKTNRMNKKDAKKLLKYSAPLVPNATCSWITNVSDKVMLSYYLGTSANGIYSISTKFTLLLSHVYSVFNLSWTESASENANEKDRDEYFSEITNNIFLICACICLLVLAAMPIVFRILINSNYNEAYNYIPLLIIASLFELFASILSSMYVSLKLSGKIATSTIIAGLINIGVNFLFMKKYGIKVACISTICAYVFLSVYRMIDISKYIKLKLDIKKYLYVVVVLVILIFLYQYNSIIISIISVIGMMIFTLFLNKEIISVGWRKIYSKIKRNKGQLG